MTTCQSFQLTNKFEEVVSNSNNYNYIRSCRNMIVPDNIHMIQPGQYCILEVSGGGYFVQWYYYKTCDGRHMIIFESNSGDEPIYSCREIFSTPVNIFPQGYCQY